MSITEKKFFKPALLAMIVALIGIADASYLTYKHYMAAPVPCSIIEGCEMVLTSPYSKLWGIPLSALGLAAYVAAFIFAALSIRGSRAAWGLFSAQTTLMALFSVYLLYLQGAVIGHFCQFCLISAAVSFLLFTITLVSFIIRPKYV